MRTSSSRAAICLVACLSIAWTTNPGAAVALAPDPTVTLNLQLNETSGSTVASDSSGMGHNGAIGSHVRMNGSYADWDRHSPAVRTYYGADHLIMIPDAADGSLDPDTGNFSVEFRYRTTDKFGNVLQKGQATAPGGQIKFQQPKGFISCMYKSPTTRAAIKSKTAVNDGQWHVIRCDRTPTEVALYVDGVRTNRIRKPTGDINNKKPWTLGGKFECDPNNPNQGADSCDYFPGDIDYLTITKG